METISADLIRGKIDALILRRLVEGEAYGTQISRFITEASNGSYELKKPTLYSALRRLEGQKFITGTDRIVDHIRRRYYNLTPKGVKYFDTRKDDWRFSNDVISNLLFGNPYKYEMPTGAEVLNKFFAEKKEIELPLAAGYDLPLVETKPVHSPTPVFTDPVPLRPFVLKEKETEDNFQKYLGPEERPVWERQREIDALNKPKQQTRPDKEESVYILSHNNSWKTRSSNRFLLINRLRAAVSLVSALVIAITLAVSGYFITDQVGGYTAFVLGFVALAVYLAINFAIFTVYPFLKKRHSTYRKEFLIRLAISVSIVVIFFGAMLIAGQRDTQMTEYFAFFLVPSLLGLVVFLEGVWIYLLKRFKFFQV